MKTKITSAALLFTMLLNLVFVTGCFGIGPIGIAGGGEEAKLNIQATATSTMQYDAYDNGLISLEIPKGWTVQTVPVDYIHYTFKCFDPQAPDYFFLFDLKLEGFLKSEAARKKWASLYPSSGFGKLAPIDPMTTEQFYLVWNTNADYANEVDLGGLAYFPHLNDFTVIENLGKMSLGGDLLRAHYTTDSGSLQQGLFTTCVMSAGSYYLYGIDMAPLSAYHTVFMAAPDAEFNNWQSILDHCLGTLQFSQAFLNGFNQAEAQLAATVQANQKIYDQISDMIMDSWEKRNSSYDLISQKQSDATLGYERVYDTETNEVYRAYNGFTDDYSGDRYKPVTDEMYTAPISGYIQK